MKNKKINNIRKKLDILDVKSIENSLNKYEPDYIIHLASLFNISAIVKGILYRLVFLFTVC